MMKKSRYSTNVMSTLISKSTLKIRILSILVVPLLAVSTLLFMEVNDHNEKRINSQNLVSMALYTSQITDLIHELQRERGRSAGYLASGSNANLLRLLNTQRIETDKILQSINRIENTIKNSGITETWQDLVLGAFKELKYLPETRALVNDNAIAVSAMLDYYTAIIDRFLFSIENIALQTDNLAISRMIISYGNLTQAIEKMGLERAAGNIGFSSGRFSEAVYARFLFLLASQETYLKSFELLAPPAVQKEYQALSQFTVVHEVQKMRNIAINQKNGLIASDVDSAYWFQQITDKIDLFIEIEGRFNMMIVTEAQKELTNAKDLISWLKTLLVISIMAIMMCMWMVFTRIVKPMDMLKKNFPEGTDYSGELNTMSKSLKSLNVEMDKKLNQKTSE